MWTISYPKLCLIEDDVCVVSILAPAGLSIRV